jgi:hypothetical protein
MVLELPAVAIRILRLAEFGRASASKGEGLPLSMERRTFRPNHLMMKTE